MSDRLEAEVEIQVHEEEGSWTDGWPAMLVSVIIIAAAIYSFSPRPKPPFPPTQIEIDELLITDLAQHGQRIVGVGEQGRIFYADQPQGPWRQAKLGQNRGSTFTEALFLDARTVIAVGHDSWIVRSSDGGKSWTEVMFDPDRAEPLLGVAGPFDGSIMAYGAFGQLQVSNDAGRVWARRELVKKQVEESDDDAMGSDPFASGDSEASSDPFADPFGGGSDEDYNPFADFGSGAAFDDFSTRHINAISQASDGSLWLAGERGLVARSTDGGFTWTQFETGYNGSFYGAIETASGRMLFHGMRGNIYSTRDLGESFQRSKTNTQESLFGGMLADNGDILLVGGSNMIIRSENGGRTFAPVADKQRDGLTDILKIDHGFWLTAGEGGIRMQGPNAPAQGAEQ